MKLRRRRQSSRSWPGSGRDDSPTADTSPQVEAVVEEVIRRRRAGEHTSDEQILRDHPELLPELADRLQMLKEIEAARRRAERLHAGTDVADDAGALDVGHLERAFPGYRLLNPISYGGQGVVYRAVQLSTNRVVALKALLGGPLASSSQRRRFAREAELLAQLEHPHIVRLYDSGITRGTPYFAMELIDGRPIDDYAVLHDLGLDARIRLFFMVCDAVTAAHQRGIIHRDLKPSNVLVDPKGQPHLLDFGLGKCLQPVEGVPADMTVTTTGQVMGSLPYLSPEQISGSENQLDTRTDVYSLGILLFKLLTDVYPYDLVGNAHTVRQRILEHEPIPLRRALGGARLYENSYLRRINADLEAVINKALAKDREGRYQGVAEFAEDLRSCLAGHAVIARPNKGLYALRKTARKHRRLLLVAAVLVFFVGAVAGAIGYLVLERRAAVATGDLRMSLERDFNVGLLRQLQDARAEANRVAERQHLPPEFHHAHMARYRRPPVAPGDRFRKLTVDMPASLVDAVQCPGSAEFEAGRQWLEAAGSDLDSLARTLAETSFRFPIETKTTYLFGASPADVVAATRCADAFLARTYLRYADSDHQQAVADLTAARRLAADLGDSVRPKDLSWSVYVRYQTYAFVQRVLSELIPQPGAVDLYVSWMLADPDVPRFRGVLAFEEVALTEFLSAAFTADASGQRRSLDLFRLNELMGGLLEGTGPLTPQHYAFAAQLQPEDVRRLIQRHIHAREDWDDLTYPDLVQAIRAQVDAQLIERRENPVLFALPSSGRPYEAKLRCRALCRALRLAAVLIRYREQNGEWPREPLDGLLGDPSDDLVDPMTGKAFAVDIAGGVPRVRSSKLHGLLKDGELPWAGQELNAMWVTPGDNRVTYFPCRSPAPG